MVGNLRPTFFLLLTAVGLYGVLSFGRPAHREIGIRMALSAARDSVVVRVVRQAWLGSPPVS